MELRIRTKNLQINELVRCRVARRFKQAVRHLPGPVYVTVGLSSESARAQKERILIQVAFSAGGANFRVEQRAASLLAGVISATEAVERQIKRYKGTAYRSNRARRYPSFAVLPAEDLARAIDTPKEYLRPSH